MVGDGDKVTGLTLARTRVEGGKCVLTDETYTLPVGVVIKAIGYYARPLEGLDCKPNATCYPNVDGKIADGLWAVGWAKRGPSGVIATNRQDSIDVATRLMNELPQDHKKHARDRIDAMLKERGVRVVHFRDWEKIEKEEHGRAKEGAPRSKITEWRELLDHAHRDGE